MANGSQVLPADDAFTSTAQPFGTNLCLYLGCAVSTAGSPHDFQRSRMHGGYQVIDGSGVSETPCAVSRDISETTTEPEPRGFMFRQPVQDDTIVSATIRARSLAGALTFLNLAPRGVMARIKAGSLTDDGTSFVRYEDVTCYLATVYLSGTDLLFSLDRVITGTITNLAVETLPLASAILLDVTQPLTITLDAQTNGGDVDLIASYAGFSAGEAVVQNFTDSSGSKITGGLRAGFHMGRDRTYFGGSVEVVDLCDVFTINEVGVGQTLVDQFSRYQPSSALAVGTDQFGNDGPSLQMAYAWDQFTHANGTPRFLADLPDGAKFVYSGADDSDGRAFISSRTSTSQHSQHRRFIAHLTAQPGSNTVWLGVCARSSQAIPEDGTADFPLFNGYAGVCIGQSAAATAIFAIYRISNGAPLLLASFDDTGSTHFPGYASDFTIALECFPQQLEAFNDPVILALSIDGTQVVLIKNPAVDSGLDGVTVDATGLIVDGNSTRIPPAFGEGILTFNVDATLTGEIDDWVELVLTNQTLPDRDQLSVALGDEGTATATFTILDPGEPMELRLEHYSILSPPMESGHRRSIPRFTDDEDNAIGRRRYRFSRSGVSKAELDTLIAFFDAREGAEELFNWTPPREAASRKVHLVAGRFLHRKADFDTYDIDFTLETNV